MDSNKQEDTVSHQSHGYNFLFTAVIGKGLLVVMDFESVAGLGWKPSGLESCALTI